jgi:hypothetical protein
MWPGADSFAINIDKDLSIPDAPDDTYIYWMPILDAARTQRVNSRSPA